MSLVMPAAHAPEPPESSAQTQLPRTDVEIGRVYDPVLRDALIAFEASLSPVSPITTNLGLPSASSSWPLASVVLALSGDPQPAPAQLTAAEWVVVSGRPASRQDGAVRIVTEAVAEIRDILGFTQQEVLQAAGIRKRTFHNWRKSEVAGVRPASVGRLWELHAVVLELQELAGPAGVRHWFARDRARKKALLKGDFDELVAEASRRESPAQPESHLLGAAETEEKLQITVKPLRGFTVDPKRTVEPRK